MRNKAIFLDRDGTLIKDVGYLKAPEQIEFITNIPELLLGLKKEGYLLIVVSNQSGVARGYFSAEEVVKINDELNCLLFRHHGVEIDAFYFCPHHPDYSECSCRKPKPGMILQAVKDFNIDLSKSMMVGDKDSDHILLPDLRFVKIERDKDWSSVVLELIETKRG